MSLQSSQSRLKDALKELRIAWYRARGEWDDGASRKFEEDVLLPLDGKIIAAIGAIARLSEVLEAARRDCDKAD